ncbi:MAG: transcription factor S [Promethearchaeota archaeon]
MVKFCDTCGGLMLPTTIEGKKMFKCKCGAVEPFDDQESDSYVLTTKVKHSAREEITNAAEILKWKEDNLRSSIKNFRCPKCGYDKCQLETRQTRRADEGMTHFIICLKCGKMIKIGS